MRDKIVLGTVTLEDDQQQCMTLNIGRRDEMMRLLQYIKPAVKATFTHLVPWWLVKYLISNGLRCIVAPNGNDTSSRVALAHARKRSITIEK